jgi:hypothetical protein
MVDVGRDGAQLTQTTFALPIPADRVEAVRAFVVELLGPRRAEFERSWRDKGITQETAWLQQTPEGALVLVSMEAEDLPRAFAELAVSDSEFDRWYRQRVLEIYGVDLRRGAASNELLAAWRAP